MWINHILRWNSVDSWPFFFIAHAWPGKGNHIRRQNYKTLDSYFLYLDNKHKYGSIKDIAGRLVLFLFGAFSAMKQCIQMHISIVPSARKQKYSDLRLLRNRMYRNAHSFYRLDAKKIKKKDSTEGSIIAAGSKKFIYSFVLNLRVKAFTCCIEFPRPAEHIQ